MEEVAVVEAVVILLPSPQPLHCYLLQRGRLLYYTYPAD